MPTLVAGAIVLLMLGIACAAKGRGVLALAAAMLVVGSVSGQLATVRSSATREAQIPVGTVTMLMRVTTDAQPYFGSRRFVAVPSAVADGGEWRDWRGPPIEVHVDPPADVSVGEYLVVSGDLAARLG
ncbi:MAG: hypothetical protein KJO18_04080, partial [Acidimicrobiia bacterium]|nr:hypothetical protein [Acidimicrobiia bacterium]